MKRRALRQGTPQFWEAQLLYESVAQSDDPLMRLCRLIDWEAFRPSLLKIRKENSIKGGRPPYDELFLFKSLVLEYLYSLSDEQFLLTANESIRFRVFLGIGFSSDLPDHSTLWRFRSDLMKELLWQPLLDQLKSQVRQAKLLLRRGKQTEISLVKKPSGRPKRRGTGHHSENTSQSR